jgi:polyisoprenoid-binding protein YceI
VNMIPRLHPPSRLLALLGFAAVAAAPLPLFAARLEVDAKNSAVNFAAKATGHTVEGTVTRWKLDANVPDGAEVPDTAVFSAEVPTMTTDHKKRDEEMLLWIEPAKFATITFRLQSLTKAATGYTAIGEFEMHGVKAPLSMPVTIQRAGQRLTIHGEVVIDHRSFGLPQIRKFGFLTVDPEVKVVFDVAGDLK